MQGQGQTRPGWCVCVPWLLVLLLSMAHLSTPPRAATYTSATSIRTRADPVHGSTTAALEALKAEPVAAPRAAPHSDSAVRPHLVHCATNQPHLYAGTKSAPAGLAVPDFAFPADADVCKLAGPGRSNIISSQGVLENTRPG